MLWTKSFRADRRAARIADRHYSRQSPGHCQFVPPGRCLVLVTDGYTALWVSSAPYAEFVKHEWAGAWICSIFRNEGAGLSSELIREAIAATRWYFGEPPALGMVTFVDARQVRHKRDPGRCFRKAGFRPCGQCKDGKLALQLLPEAMPAAEPPIGAQLELLDRT